MPQFETAEDYFHSLNADAKEIAESLHRFLTTYEDITSKIKYNIPFYYQNSWICYINKLKGGGVELAFTRGYELSATKYLLTFNGRKNVGGFIINHADAIPWEQIDSVMQEALHLDLNKKQRK